MGKHKKIIQVEFDGKLVDAKECTACNTVKSLGDFRSCKGGKGGVRSKCLECEKLQARIYQRENTKKVRERDAKYYKNNRSKVNERCKNWRINNLEYDAYRSREYRKNNLQKSRQLDKLCKHRRLARKRSLPDTLTAEQQTELLTHFGGCALTGETNDIHLDHVLPLASNHGGTYHGNMIPLRADLNCSKNDANVFEWFETNRQRFNLSQTKFDAMIYYIAELNGMSVDEYRKWYDDCYYGSDRANGRDEHVI